MDYTTISLYAYGQGQKVSPRCQNYKDNDAMEYSSIGGIGVLQCNVLLCL